MTSAPLIFRSILKITFSPFRIVRTIRKNNKHLFAFMFAFMFAFLISSSYVRHIPSLGKGRSSDRLFSLFVCFFTNFPFTKIFSLCMLICPLKSLVCACLPYPFLLPVNLFYFTPMLTFFTLHRCQPLLLDRRVDLFCFTPLSTSFT